MEKIPTLFDRNWDSDRKVNPTLAVADFDFDQAIATEKLDGTNVRVTVRNKTVFIFSIHDWKQRIVYENVPTDYEGLKAWLPEQKSILGNDCGIEGIVWHNLQTGQMCKVKTKDFA